jgi:hypothetical protein
VVIGRELTFEPGCWITFTIQYSELEYCVFGWVGIPIACAGDSHRYGGLIVIDQALARDAIHMGGKYHRSSSGVLNHREGAGLFLLMIGVNPLHGATGTIDPQS